MIEEVKACSADGRELAVTLEEVNPGDAHCGVQNLRHEDELIADLLAEAVIEIHDSI